jgi:hypothetical protein
MTKQHKDSIADDAQESLVDALENIKNLLEKSENKLSAARESIALANSSTSRARTQSSGEDIPVLEEEVIPTLGGEDEVPTLGDEIEADLNFDITSSDTRPTFNNSAPPVIQGISSEDVMELVDEFQDRLPAILNKTITSCSLSNLEGDLFEALLKEINQLRNEVKQLDK